MCELGVLSGCLSKMMSTKYRPPSFMHTGASRTAALDDEEEEEEERRKYGKLDVSGRQGK